MGCINDKDNDMAKFITWNNQYRFELKREQSQLWITDNSYKYKCYIDIYNNITDSLIVRLNCSENDIMNMLDCYTQMSEYCLQDIVCPNLAPYTANGNFYIITMELFRINDNVMMDVSSRWFNVKEYNPLKEELVDIISIEMNCDELEDLINLIFFIFLVDNDEKFGIVPIDSGVPSEFL
jgi:hypothetical protein